MGEQVGGTKQTRAKKSSGALLVDFLISTTDEGSLVVESDGRASSGFYLGSPSELDQQELFEDTET